MNSEYCRHKVHKNQFGFRKQRSAIIQFLLSLDSIYQQYDDKKVRELIVLYLDFAKAFAKVVHDLLIQK